MQQKVKNLRTIEYLNSGETSLAMIGIRKDGILEIRFKFDNYEVDVKDQLEIHEIFMKLTENGRFPFNILVIPGKFGSITKEARKIEMFETSGFQNQISLAIVVNGLSQRILGTLYLALKKHKPKYPYKLFDSEESATEWIQNEKKQIL